MIGDDALIRALYEQYGGSLLRFVVSMTADRSAAEDIVQETLIRAWRHPDVLVNGKGSVRSWLFTVARNITIDHARARAARPKEEADSAEPVTHESDHAEQVANTLTVMAALDRLSDEHRRVLEETYLRDRGVADAADVLGIPPGTVKSRTYHALRALKAVLSASAEGVWP